MSAVEQLPARGGLVASVAENVRVETARKGWVQADIARALRTSRTSISARWMGARPWQLEDLEQVAAALEIPVTRLLLPRLDSNQEPADSQLPLVRGILARLRAIARRDRGRDIRGAASGPVAPVYSIQTGERVAFPDEVSAL